MSLKIVIDLQDLLAVKIVAVSEQILRLRSRGGSRSLENVTSQWSNLRQLCAVELGSAKTIFSLIVADFPFGADLDLKTGMPDIEKYNYFNLSNPDMSVQRHEITNATFYKCKFSQLSLMK